MRLPLIVALLVVSHGAVMWLGSSRNSGAASSSPASAPGKAESSGLSLDALVQTGRRISASREAKDETADIETEVGHARSKFAADADFRAILEAGIVSPWDVPPEMRAALEAWLDRDPLVALGWISDFRREYRSNGANDAVVAYFRRGGVSRLQEFIGKEPRIREYLVECAADSFEKGDEDRALQVAATLTRVSDRRELLKGGFSSGMLAGHLESIRRLLDDKEADKFLDSIAGYSHEELLEEVKQAGFPQEAVLRFEREILEGPPTKMGRNNIDAILNNPNRVDTGATWDSILHTNSDFIGVLPELPSAVGSTGLGTFGLGQDPSPDGQVMIGPDLLAEIQRRSELLRQGRLSPAELASWLKEVGPGGPELDRRIARIIRNAGLFSDPEATLSWLKESRPDWRELMNEANDWRSLPPELLAGLAGDYPEGTEESSSFHPALIASFDKWLESDPEACREAIGRMPEGPLKESLLNPGKTEEEEE
jgi:hypothetical protein